MLYQQETSKCPVPNDFLTRSEGYRSWPLRSHNPKVAGSNPAPATTEGRETKGVDAFGLFGFSSLPMKLFDPPSRDHTASSVIHQLEISARCAVRDMRVAGAWTG